MFLIFAEILLRKCIHIVVMKNQLLKNNLDKRLKNLRKTENMTQERFAELIGVSRTAVAKWENGYAEPTLKNIVRISKVFNVSSDYLLGVNIKKENIQIEISDEAFSALNKFISEIKKS